MKLDRSDVACVREEPRFVGALADPVETRLRQRRADAAATLIEADEDAGEVVAARSRIGGRVRFRLEDAGATVAEDHVVDFGHDQSVLEVVNLPQQHLSPGSRTPLGGG